MHLKSLLVSTLFYSIPVIHAVTIAEVNGYNTGLANDANDYDSNVKDLKLLNDVTASKTVANNVASFASAVAQGVELAQGAEKVTGDAQEETVIEPYQSLTEATGQFMSDLAGKANLLTLQKTNIRDSLNTLLINFQDLSLAISKLLPDTDYEEEETDDTSTATSRIREAQSAFA